MQHGAGIVLGWETACELKVLLPWVWELMQLISVRRTQTSRISKSLVSVEDKNRQSQITVDSTAQRVQRPEIGQIILPNSKFPLVQFYH